MLKKLFGKAATSGTAVLLTISLLAGCSSNNAGVSPSASAGPSSETGQIAGGKEVKITLMDWQDPSGKYAKAYNYGFDEYMKLHPNVKIKHVYQPSNGYDTLLDTQFVSHKAPDAVQLNDGQITKYMDQDNLLQLDLYMKEGNPYNDNQTWVDTFVNGEGAYKRMKSRNKYGAISFVSIDGGPGIAPLRPFYYNKDILAKSGVDKVPTTWAEFMEACEKIMAAGYNPIAADNDRFLSWTFSWVANQTGEGYFNQFFDEKYHNSELYEDKALAAIMLDKLTKEDPELQGIYALLKDYSKYWQKGWSAGTTEQAEQLFAFGQAAFILDGNWIYGYFEENIKGFEFGVMPFPLITKESMPLSLEKMPAPGSQLDYGWGLNKDLEKDPAKLEVLIDLFKFLTSTDIQQKMSEIGVYAPVTQGVVAPEKLAPFLATEGDSLKEPIDNPLFQAADMGGKAKALSQEWLTGKMDDDKYMDDMFKAAKESSLQKVRDMLDEKVGLPNQIATLEKLLSEQVAAKVPAIISETTQESLDLAKLKYEFYQQYLASIVK